MAKAFESGPLEFIRHIFEQIGFPFLRVDLVELADGLDEFDPQAGFIAELKTKTDRNPAFIAAMRGLMRSIEVPPHFARLFSESPVLRDDPQRSKQFMDLIASANAPFGIAEHNGGLFWQEATPWPLAYAGYLDQLIALTSLYQALILERRAQLAKQYEGAGVSAESIEVLDQTSRVLPTRQHYAVASFGAWLGGAQNWQYLSLFATGPQLRESATNIEYLKRILYSDTDAEELDAGGIIAIPASLATPLLKIQQSTIPIIGGTYIDENNISNPPAGGLLTSPEAGKEVLHPGLLLDKQYRSVFWARPIERQALYGARDVFRDHYGQFYKELNSVETLRCKHYCVPVVEVSSMKELRQLITAIPLHSKEGIFFRGQSSLYLLDRPARVRKLLFGDSCSLEPSLSTAAARSQFDYDSLHFALRYFLEYYVLETGRKRETAEERRLFEQWKRESNSALCEIDYAVMALAQHYGLPSHGLDVTDDVEVAAWFATNTLKRIDGMASYTTMLPDQWNTDRKKWPVIFALQRVTHSLGMSVQRCREFESFGLPVLRPQRQAASFYLGGHSDHQNRLGESLVCAFRLKPSIYQLACNFDLLFPSPTEDPAYAAMLRFQESSTFANLTGGQVTKFHATV